ncbi:MAG: YceI family protein [Bacteroidales bacterium]|jgi:polyisoprenoid-binding protein YceI|nr:YceI family protein [Bacteroidales bacterium]
MMKIKILAAFIFLGFGGTLLAQSQLKLDLSQSDVQITGTSTIHDWEIDCEKFSGFVTGNISKNENEIEKATFEVIVESMKSGNSSMDDEVYEALDEESYPKINYQYIKTKEISGSNGNYTALVQGKLTISGVTKLITLKISIKVTDEGVLVEGGTQFNMTTFEITPPSAFFGTINSGDLVKINFKLMYK